MEERKGTGRETGRSASRPKAAARAAVVPRKQAAPAKKGGRRAAASVAEPVPPDREAMVRTAAYLRAERRGFAPGHEFADWLAAEAEVDGLLARPAAAKPRKKAPPKPRTR